MRKPRVRIHHPKRGIWVFVVRRPSGKCVTSVRGNQRDACRIASARLGVEVRLG
jgi:hypothetical protein